MVWCIWNSVVPMRLKCLMYLNPSICYYKGLLQRSWNGIFGISKFSTLRKNRVISIELKEI